MRQAAVYGEFSLCGGLGSWSGPAFCPGLSARTDCEGVIGGVRGFPPVSIGTESHRGSDGGGARSLVPAPFLYAPPADPRRTERRWGGVTPTFVNYAVSLCVDSKHDREQECVSSQGEKNFKTTEGLLGRLSSLV